MNYALVKILYNLPKGTWHPIWYRESPLPGGPQAVGNKEMIRFKSVGHHTAGFHNRGKALADISMNLLIKISEMGFNYIIQELEEDLPWDDIEVPADIQLRTRPHVEQTP
jgi:hypothetical protein